jgi:hypothetical protein
LIRPSSTRNASLCLPATQTDRVVHPSQTKTLLAFRPLRYKCSPPLDTRPQSDLPTQPINNKVHLRVTVTTPHLRSSVSRPYNGRSRALVPERSTRYTASTPPTARTPRSFSALSSRAVTKRNIDGMARQHASNGKTKQGVVGGIVGIESKLGGDDGESDAGDCCCKGVEWRCKGGWTGWGRWEREGNPSRPSRRPLNPCSDAMVCLYCHCIGPHSTVQGIGRHIAVLGAAFLDNQCILQ